ncbi:MAG TPA: hypothetical protein VLA31_02065, partial [Burkholderiaceae bacterium]|nr:hypothetical protein [Burkholderiaceae bacterium]
MQVPSRYVLGKFMALLAELPPNVVTEARLQSLRTSESACKKWSRRFRETWSLSWGEAPCPHGVTPAGTERRAVLFMKWLKLWHEHFGNPASFVVVNMDETMLGNVKASKKGITDPCSEGLAGAAQEPRRDSGLPRTSLLAAVCSDADVQPLLPQVRLPRAAAGKVPSRRVLDAYAAAGPPQTAWHGGAGFISERSAMWYLGRVKKAVREVRPHARVLLVWDACPVHLMHSVLRHARKLDIGIVVVPGRMTWLLQPLDTHVFAVLKKRIRDMEFQSKAAARRSTLPPLQRVRMHGSAVREVLVERSWVETMRRSGLAPGGAELRPALQKILSGRAISPAMPSVAELAEMLGIPEARAETLRALLVPPVMAAVGAAAAAAPVVAGMAAAAAASGPEDTPPAARWVAPLVLSRNARLPG